MKYEITDITAIHLGRTLHRIRALKDFGSVKAGTLGGWIENEENLSQEGLAWIADNALAFGDALVRDNAQVSGNALLFDSALVRGNAQVSGNALISGGALISDDALVAGAAIVCGKAQVFDAAQIRGNARVSGDAQVSGNAIVCDNALIRRKSDIIQVGPIGCCDKFATFFNCSDGLICVKYCDFHDTIDKFTKIYGETRCGNEYRMAIELAKAHIMSKI